jgi:hypothetical protein
LILKFSPENRLKFLSNLKFQKIQKNGLKKGVRSVLFETFDSKLKKGLPAAHEIDLFFSCYHQCGAGRELIDLITLDPVEMEKRLKCVRNLSLACKHRFNIWKPIRIDFLRIPVRKPEGKKKLPCIVIKAEFPGISVVLSYNYERPPLCKLQKFLHAHLAAGNAPASNKA